MFKSLLFQEEQIKTPTYQKLDIDYEGISKLLDSLRLLHGKIDQKLLEDCVKEVMIPKGILYNEK